MTDDERMRLMSTSQSLSAEPTMRLPTAIAGLETFSLSDSDDDEDKSTLVDADSLFNLPDADDEDEDDDPRQP
jgi:hypothetical protein